MRILHRVRFAIPVVLALSALASVLHAQEATAGAAPASTGVALVNTADAIDQDYLVSPDDVLDVYIIDVPELSRQYRVNPSGTIGLPLLNKPLRVVGLTLVQLADLVTKELKAAGLVSNPQVTITVQQSRSHSVSITGAVGHPQIYPVFSRTTLLDVLSQAGGLADDAGNVAIIRRGDIAARALGLDQSSQITQQQSEAALTVRVDLQQLMENGDATVNVQVYPGDRVTIPRAGIVYVVGAVNKPGGFTIPTGRQEMTVLQAVALAQDLKGTALREATIIRVDATALDGRAQIPVNLKKILAGQAPDPTLLADDILFVPDSSSKKALRRGAEAILQITTGLALYRH